MFRPSNRVKIAVVGAAALVAVAVPVWSSAAGTSVAATAPLCRNNDVSYYYGGYFAGLGQRSFDVTLLAHDGVTCRLSDTPQITFAGPSTTPIKTNVDGRGGTLVLSPRAPLHLTINYNTPDTANDKVSVSTLTLRMPGVGRGAQAEPFGFPGNTVIAKKIGIGVSAWTTGIGLGQNESDE